MSKRRSPILRSPPVVCPSCRGPLLATWNPTDRVINRLECTHCAYSFDFGAYRATARIRAHNELVTNSPPLPHQCAIPGTG